MNISGWCPDFQYGVNCKFKKNENITDFVFFAWEGSSVVCLMSLIK